MWKIIMKRGKNKPDAEFSNTTEIQAMVRTSSLVELHGLNEHTDVKIDRGNRIIKIDASLWYDA